MTSIRKQLLVIAGRTVVLRISIVPFPFYTSEMLQNYAKQK